MNRQFAQHSFSGGTQQISGPQSPYAFVPFAASEPERSDIDAFYQNERELLTGWMDIRGYVKTRLALPDAAAPAYAPVPPAPAAPVPPAPAYAPVPPAPSAPVPPAPAYETVPAFEPAPVNEPAPAYDPAPAFEPVPVPEETPVEEPAFAPAPEQYVPQEPVAEAPAAPQGKVCPNCGTVMEPDCNFCLECGTRLN